MPISDLTSPGAVEAALDEFDQLGRDAFLKKYGFGRARRYFVSRDGNHYDSKAIVGAAVGFEHPDRGPLPHTDFNGGEHGAKARLEQLGFKVVARPDLAAADKLPLRDALAAALAAQQDRVPGEWSDDLQKAIAVTLPNAIRGVVGEGFRVRGSAGAGNQAEIPWVSVMPPGTKGASEGQYVVYLFASDGKRVFLALSQAVTGQPKKELVGLAKTLRNAAGAQPDLVTEIDLAAEGDLGVRYAMATAYAKEYKDAALPAQDVLESDLERFLKILEVVLGTDSPGNGEPPEPVPAALLELHNELTRKRQVILQGPPGVGKTFHARWYIEWMTSGSLDSCRLTTHLSALSEGELTPSAVAQRVLEGGSRPIIWDIVQFHPSYTYEDFIRGLVAKPLKAGGVTFEAENKVCGWIAAVAQELAALDTDARALLVIDEINRGDISKIFGELIYALEYRDEPVASPYAVSGSREIILPSNLLLIGTMNTADRSIALVDYALRRRFSFLDVRPDRAVIDASDRFAGEGDRSAAIWLFDRVASLFAGGESDLLNLQVGHSYFLPDAKPANVAEGLAALARRFAYEVYPLLFEYAAEDRFQNAELEALLSAIGIASPDAEQGEIAHDVESVLQQEPWKTSA